MELRPIAWLVTYSYMRVGGFQRFDMAVTERSPILFITDLIIKYPLSEHRLINAQPIVTEEELKAIKAQI